MKVLLMSMPDIHPFFRTWKAMTPSLALSSIAGNLDERHSVGIADLVLKRKNVRSAVLEALAKVKPDIVGLSAMSFQYDTAIRIARFIKGIDSRIKIAIGGYHATLMYESIAESKDAQHLDFLVRGEADVSFHAMVNSIESGRPVDSIDGLSYRSHGTFIHNKQRALEEMSALKCPNRKARIWKGYHFFGMSFDTLESSRGCVLGCSFCSIRQMYGKSFRTYSLSRVMEDIGCAKALGTRCLFFTDDNITLDIKRFEGIIDRIIECGHDDMTYIIQASSTGISSSDSLVEKMARAGFRFVFLGIESFLKGNLTALNKGGIAEKSIRAIEMLRNHDIHVVGGLIMGNPDDTRESIEENYRLAASAGVSSIYDQILTPYLKTEIRDELLERGLVTNENNYKLYNGHFANVKTKHLSASDLDRIKYKMVQKYSPNFLEGSLRWRKIVWKHYLLLALKLILFGIVDYVSARIKKLCLNEEGFFLNDYRRCIDENLFNVP